MERRKFVIGLGALASGSAAATGTGALTSSSSERDLHIDVATSDDTGFVGIEALSGPNSVFVNQSGSTGGGLSVNIENTNNGADGLNEDSAFLFDDLFQIRNQGNQPVWIWAEVSGPFEPYVMDGEGSGGKGDRRSIRESGQVNGGVDLGPRGKAFHFYVGERKNVGLKISTQGRGSGSIGSDGALTINAAGKKSLVPDNNGFDVQPGPQNTSE